MPPRISYFLAILAIVISSTMISAYAEVTSLTTNKAFYTPGSKIYFTGTVVTGDTGKIVNLIIHDPTNKFLSPLEGTLATSDGTFQIVVTPSKQYSVKGIYNATAFILKESNGKTVSFIFSPDGTTMSPSSPTLTGLSRSSTEIDLSWSVPTNNGGSTISGYRIERNDGNGFNVIIQNIPSTSYHDTGLTSNKLYSYRVYAVNSAGMSDPSNVVTATTLSSQTIPPSTHTPTPETPPLSLDELLKQRLEAAQRLQELLHGKPSNSPTPPTSGKQQSVNLSENVGLGDTMPANLESKKSNSISENNLALNSFTNFDIKSVLYPAISLVGVGMIVTILYFRKKQKLAVDIRESQEAHLPVEQTFEKQDDDYAMMILKNRLAKGEITIDEFKALKDELSEP